MSAPDQVPGVGEATAPQRPSNHGRALGLELARLADAMVEAYPEIPDRCKTCAFREGTIPNQMAGTLVEALNCVVGLDPANFGCHQTLDTSGLPTTLCAGYILARLAPFNDVKQALIRVTEKLDDAPTPPRQDTRAEAADG